MSGAHILAYVLGGALVATPIGQTTAARIQGDAGAQASFVQSLSETVRLDLARSPKAKAHVYASDATARAKAAAALAKKGDRAGAKKSAQAYEIDMIFASLSGKAGGSVSAAAKAGRAAVRALPNSAVSVRTDLSAGARASQLSKKDLELAVALQNKTHLSLSNVLNLHLSGKSWGFISLLGNGKQAAK